MVPPSPTFADPDRSRKVSARKLPMELGMPPVREFPLKLSETRLVRAPTVDGMVATK